MDLAKKDLFAVKLVWNGKPVLNELLVGDNNSAEINGIKTKLRECDNLSKSVLLTTDHLNIGKYQN